MALRKKKPKELKSLPQKLWKNCSCRGRFKQEMIKY